MLDKQKTKLYSHIQKDLINVDRYENQNNIFRDKDNKKIILFTHENDDKTIEYITFNPDDFNVLEYIEYFSNRYNTSIGKSEQYYVNLSENLSVWNLCFIESLNRSHEFFNTVFDNFIDVNDTVNNTITLLLLMRQLPTYGDNDVKSELMIKLIDKVKKFDRKIYTENINSYRLTEFYNLCLHKSYSDPLYKNLYNDLFSPDLYDAKELLNNDTFVYGKTLSFHIDYYPAANYLAKTSNTAFYNVLKQKDNIRMTGDIINEYIEGKLTGEIVSYLEKITNNDDIMDNLIYVAKSEIIYDYKMYIREYEYQNDSYNKKSVQYINIPFILSTVFILYNTTNYEDNIKVKELKEVIDKIKNNIKRNTVLYSILSNVQKNTVRILNGDGASSYRDDAYDYLTLFLDSLNVDKSLFENNIDISVIPFLCTKNNHNKINVPDKVIEYNDDIKIYLEVYYNLVFKTHPKFYFYLIKKFNISPYLILKRVNDSDVFYNNREKLAKLYDDYNKISAELLDYITIRINVNYKNGLTFIKNQYESNKKFGNSKLAKFYLFVIYHEIIFYNHITSSTAFFDVLSNKLIYDKTEIEDLLSARLLFVKTYLSNLVNEPVYNGFVDDNISDSNTFVYAMIIEILLSNLNISAIKSIFSEITTIKSMSKWIPAASKNKYYADIINSLLLKLNYKDF